MAQPDVPLAIGDEPDFELIADSDLVSGSEEVVLEDDDVQRAAAWNDSDGDAVKGNSVYRKLVDICSPRWTTTYQKRPEGDQLELIEPVRKEPIFLADYLNPPVDYVVGTTNRCLGDTMVADMLLVKCDGSLFWKKNEDVERPLSAEYEACITRCLDMDFVEIRLRAEYGDAAFAKHFPCRYLEFSWDSFHEMGKRQLYVDKLRSIENRWNASCARAALPPVYIEDWTDEKEDETLELVEFINYLANSAAVAGFLPQFKQLENMKCKYPCGGCVKKAEESEDEEEEAAPRCCGQRSSINIDKRTKQFAWCEDGKRGTRPRLLYYECTPECACGDKCDNRAVQTGRQFPLCIFREPATGWGVRTMQPIEADTYVTEYCGEVRMGGAAAGKGSYEFEMKRRVRDSATGDVLYEPLVISSAEKGNESRFFNHSCAPNMKSECAVIERYGLFYHHVCFFTERKILAGEELKFDYFGLRRRPSGQTRRMFESCRCGAANCRFLSSSNKDTAPKRRREVVALSSDDDNDEESTRREKRRKESDATGVLGKRVEPVGVSSDSEEEDGPMSSDAEEDMMAEEECQMYSDLLDAILEMDEDGPVHVARVSSDADEDMKDEGEECPVYPDGLDTMLDRDLLDRDMMDEYLPEYKEPPQASTRNYGGIMMVVPAAAVNVSNNGSEKDPALVSRPTTPDRPTIEGLLGTTDTATPSCRRFSFLSTTTTTPSRPMTGEEIGTPARARSGRPIATTPTARSPVEREKEGSSPDSQPRTFDMDGRGGRRETANKRDSGVSDDGSYEDEE